jgi:hypothetical protein
MLAIYSLSKSLNLDYFHTPIKYVSVHPLDPHQTISQYREYLNRLNKFVEFPSDIALVDINDFSVLEIPKLQLKSLLNLICTPTRKRKLIKLVDVYGVVDSVPGIYCHARRIVNTRVLPRNQSTSEFEPVVAVHYRSVPGDFSVYEGEGQTRQIQIDRVKGVISRALREFDKVEPKLVVYTDAPSIDMVVKVFPNQEKLWEGTPGYSNGNLHLHGRDLLAAFSNVSPNINIVVGGDPLEAIIQMTKADILITSKSSLSYVPAILGTNNQVYAPIEFWHQLPGARRF